MVESIDTRNRKIICHYCYYTEHIARQFTLKLQHIGLLIGNYDGLKAVEKANVQYTSCNNAKVYFDITK